MTSPLLTVAMGGALGASLRFLSYGALIKWLPAFSPLGVTWLVNVLGSLIIGFLFIALPKWSGGHHEFYRLLIIVGVLGSFTTVSTFSLETINLVMQQHYLKALSYVLMTVFFTLIACGTGIIIAKRVLL